MRASALTLSSDCVGGAVPRRRARTPGVAHARSWTNVRVELKTSLLDAANTWLSGSLFWPLWLRAAGMRLGRHAEVSTIVDTVPDLVTIGDESFLADGIYLGGPRVDRGTLTLAPVDGRQPRRSSAITPCSGRGRDSPTRRLLGVCTVATPAMADCARQRRGSGHPPMPLPRPPAAVDRRHHARAVVAAARSIACSWEAARLL